MKKWIVLVSLSLAAHAVAAPNCARLLVTELERRETPAILYGTDFTVNSAITGRGIPNATIAVVDPFNGASFDGASGTSNGDGRLQGSFVNPNDQEGYSTTQTVSTYEFVPAGVIMSNGQISDGELGYVDEQQTTDYPPVYDDHYDVTVSAPGYTTQTYSVNIDFDARVLGATFSLVPDLDRTVQPVMTQLSTAIHPYAVSGDAGSNSFVYVYQPGSFAPVFSARPFPGFAGGVRVALGDVDGDGIPDVAAAAGPGGGPHVIVYSGATGAVLKSFFAYDGRFSGGVNVAIGDVNGDGYGDIITGADAGGGPHLKVFSGKDNSLLVNRFAFAAEFSGGIRVAAGDIDGDGKADVIVGAGAGGGPHVIAFSGADGSVLRSFYAYDAAFHGGVYVGAGDLDGDGKAEIVTGAGAGGGSHVQVFDGATGNHKFGFFAYDNFFGGVRVAVSDGVLITGAGPGGGPHVKRFSGLDYSLIDSRFSLAPREDYTDGIFVGP